MSLPDGMDYMLRPVMAKLCLYESLLNGALALADVAVLNDALDVQAENERLYRQATDR